MSASDFPQRLSQLYTHFAPRELLKTDDEVVLWTGRVPPGASNPLPALPAAAPAARLRRVDEDEARVIVLKLCQGERRCAYFQGLKQPASLPAFFPPYHCDMCGEGIPAEQVFFKCTHCQKDVCALCAEEQRTGAATPGSQLFELRRDELAACKADPGELRPIHLARLTDTRECDECGESIGHDAESWSTTLWFEGVAGDDDDNDCYDLCATCAASEQHKDAIQERQLIRRPRQVAGLNEVAGFGPLAPWVPAYIDDDDGHMVLLPMCDTGNAFKAALVVVDDHSREGWMGVEDDVHSLLAAVAAARGVLELAESRHFHVHYS